KAKRAQKDMDWWFRFLSLWQHGRFTKWFLPETRVAVSIPGRIHLVYYWLQVTIFLLGLWYLFIDRTMTIPVIAVLIAAFLGYSVTYVRDEIKGHFK
ncbi:MAG: hypothetical protein Q7K38_00495, partial [Candidatus Wildermuthbacteria bacterium]|nr:hypothetical protein [Candidatus Wildermuthbacteria bacterium]